MAIRKRNNFSAAAFMSTTSNEMDENGGKVKGL